MSDKFDRQRYANAMEQVDEFAFAAGTFDFNFSHCAGQTQVVLSFGLTESQHQAALNRHLLTKAKRKPLGEMVVDGE